MLKFDIYYNRLGDNYAAKVDRMSMAHSIEVRSPFLDYRYMEFASRVPVKWKLSAGKTKILMRELVRGLIPDAIIDRKKHGFAGPLGDSGLAATRMRYGAPSKSSSLRGCWTSLGVPSFGSEVFTNSSYLP